MIFKTQEQRINLGLLFTRLGLAAGLLYYALPKLFGQAVLWEGVGKHVAMMFPGLPLKSLGLFVLILECINALSLITGYFYRIACAVQMVLYGLFLWGFVNAGFKVLPVYAFSLTTVFLGLFFIGPGGYIISVKFKEK